ncbi:MAG: YqaJ viral recombinase family protein [Bradymonadaceae bacterium]
MSAPAKTWTLDELREASGIVGARLVVYWREKTPIPKGPLAGRVIQMEMIDGERRWWVDGDNATTAEGESLEALEELATEEGEAEEPDNEITIAWLKEVEGIGDKAARGVVDGCKEMGITTFTELAAVEDFTRFDGIGKKNGAALREALLACDADEEPTAVSISCDACGEPGKSCKITGVMCLTCGKDASRIQTAYPVFVYGLEPGDISLAKAAVDAARHPEKIPCVDGMSERCRKLFLEWHKTTADDRSKIPKKDSPEPQPEEDEPLHCITCPYCYGLFDQAPVGAYESNWSICEADGEEGRGNCGEKFWLVARPHGYEAYKFKLTYDEKNEPAAEEVDPVIEVDPFEETEAIEEDVSTPPMDDNLFDVDDPFGVFAEDVSTDVSLDTAPDLAAYQAVPLEERVHPGLTHCRILARTEAHSEAWHKARARGIGSSDAGAILGLSPHAEPQDVWKTKTGEDTQDKPWLEDYSEFGTWFEPYIREWSSERMNVEVIDGADLGTLQSVIWDKALANIDGLDAYGVIEEYKTTTAKWTEVPAHYEAQAQHQMLVAGATEVRMIQFVCPMDRSLVPSLLGKMREIAMFPDDVDRRLADWLIENGEFHTWIVERDEAFIARLLEQEKRFWGFVEMGVIPPSEDPEGTVDLTDESLVYAACTEYARLNQRCAVIKPIQKEADTAKKKAREAISKTLALMGETPKRITIGNHKGTFVQKDNYSYWNIYTGEVEDDIPL